MSEIKSYLIEEINKTNEIIYLEYNKQLDENFWKFLQKHPAFLMTRKEYQELFSDWRAGLCDNQSWNYIIYVNTRNVQNLSLEFPYVNIEFIIAHEFGHYLSFKNNRTLRIFQILEQIRSQPKSSTPETSGVKILTNSYLYLEEKADQLGYNLIKKLAENRRLFNGESLKILSKVKEYYKMQHLLREKMAQECIEKLELEYQAAKYTKFEFSEKDKKRFKELTMRFLDEEDNLATP